MNKSPFNVFSCLDSFTTTTMAHRHFPIFAQVNKVISSHLPVPDENSDFCGKSRTERDFFRIEHSKCPGKVLFLDGSVACMRYVCVSWCV